MELARLGLVRHNVLGDGNCQFRALAFLLMTVLAVSVTHDQLRNDIVDDMDALEAVPIFPDGDSIGSFLDQDETFYDYMLRMRKNGTWGDANTLIIAARRFNVRVEVYTSDFSRAPMVYEIQGTHPVATIRLLWTAHSNHYQAVVSASESAIFRALGG